MAVCGNPPRRTEGNRPVGNGLEKSVGTACEKRKQPLFPAYALKLGIERHYRKALYAERPVVGGGEDLDAYGLKLVKREKIAQFSFLMVLVPILGEMFLDIVGGDFAASSVGVLPLCIGFVAAFASGLFACKVMIALVKRAQLKWFALYCALVALAVLIFLV